MKAQGGKLFDLALCITLVVLCASAEAQQAKIPRIGYLDESTASGSAILVNAFRQEMNRIGWIEGKNITIEYRYAEQKAERRPEIAKELVRLNVDVIVAPSTPEALAAKKVTSTVPIVMVTVGDPVGAGLISSLAQPGGNVTGLSGLTPQLITKRLEILKDVVPKLSRVGVLRLLDAVPELQLKQIRAATSALELNLEEIITELDAKGLETAFQNATRKRVNAIIPIASRSLFSERNRIVELAGKYKLPAIYSQDEFVDAGGLMSYGADLADLFRRAARYVDKILKGAKPADLPVEQPTKLEFVINLKAAKQIGLIIPPNVLARADRVIK